MLKGIVIGVVLAVVLAIVAGYLAISAGVIPANADARPSRLERWVAGSSLRATLRREAPRADDPLALTDQNLIAGVKLYAQNCAICHGDASGDRTNVARGLYQKPPQLARRGVEDDPPGITYWKMTHGIRWTAMPSFGTTLSDEQRWQLTLFLKNMNHLSAAAKRAWLRVKA